ncbi:hypothetical protein L3Y34_019541 [Caenorhabditis briggsae]|uniref:Uncharacterized protein n=1 Tax=Caenorhabditis briggsae TaxID=6238 RepID=A0AAE9D9P6_CAEBR|nr:hypothetical protein L3Y34_000543 [Caenorhabditis briggsae]ULU08422.1 hypothetical protein L3Y34_019541 [Caenorhabditis briggsae]
MTNIVQRHQNCANHKSESRMRNSNFKIFRQTLARRQEIRIYRKKKSSSNLQTVTGSVVTDQLLEIDSSSI